MEGVGFDQFLLSPTRYLDQPPAEAIVQPQAASAQPAAARPTQAPAPTQAPEATVSPETAAKPFEDFDPASFDDSTEVDNEWMPLKPGTRYVYEGTTVEDDGTVVPHRVVINVTDLTKEIGGIPAVVTWDLDYSDDQLVEAELAFFAQDKDGNVWRMGEYPEEYDEGKFIAAPTWIHGFADAMTYGHIYVASVAMGYKDEQTLKAFLEAESYPGPSLIIAYSHCIAHGIALDAGIGAKQQKLAVESGQWLLYRFDPRRAERGENPLQLDSGAAKTKVNDYLMSENRFKMLTKSKPEDARKFFAQAQVDAEKRWAQYQFLAGRDPKAGTIPAPAANPQSSVDQQP